MVRLRIIKGFKGPTLPELEQSGLLDGKDRVVEAAWTNSKAEVASLRRHRNHGLSLVVPDLAAMQRASSTLGIPLAVPDEVIATGVESLQSRDNSDWRGFTAGVGTPVAKGLLVRFASDSLRAGRNPRNLRRVVDQCLRRGVSAADADVLLGLGGL